MSHPVFYCSKLWVVVASGNSCQLNPLVEVSKPKEVWSLLCDPINIISQRSTKGAPYFRTVQFCRRIPIEYETKRRGIPALIKRLRSNGLLVSAVGIQEHVSLNWPSDRVGQPKPAFDAVVNEVQKKVVQVVEPVANRGNGEQ